MHATDLDFNWSHSGSTALVALAYGMSPGVDIELLRPRPQAMRIARRYFTDDEINWLSQLPDQAQRERAFLCLWTAKEAVLKAHGRGIAFGLHRLTICCHKELPRLVHIAQETAAAWQLHALPLAPDYIGALAWRGKPRRLCLYRINQA